MIRQARRREIREIEKELKDIGRHREFLRLLADERLQKLSKSEVVLLQKNLYEDQEIQTLFDKMKVFFQRIYQLEDKLRTLRGVVEKQIPTVD